MYLIGVSGLRVLPLSINGNGMQSDLVTIGTVRDESERLLNGIELGSTPDWSICVRSINVYAFRLIS